MYLNKTIYFLLFIFFVSSPICLPAQGNNRDLNEAKAYFSHEKYGEALSLLVNSKKLSKENKEARLLIAICYYELNKLDKALDLLNEMVSDRKAPYPECWLFLGKCYHASNQFVQAGKYYKLYLRSITPNHPNRRMVREDIRRISNGIKWQYREPLAVVGNLGQGVNTEWDEFKPIPSPNANRKLYFSSARRGSSGGARKNTGVVDETYGHYFSDIYATKISKGVWGDTKPMHYLLNSPRNEILYDFNKTGDVLFYFKGWTYDEGEIVVDTFRQESQRTLNSTPFVGPVLSSLGDGDLFFYNDTLLIFSSSREGGFGGRDLYRSVFKNGKWSIPANLGAPINTQFDEKSPFLAADGKTLYFSSNDSHKSIGGYDIFKSVYVPGNQRWTQPANLGLPLNSAGDDTDFRLSTDGFTAFFTSSRKDGLGRRDLYTAYFQKFLPEMNAPTPAITKTPETSQPIEIIAPPEKIAPEKTAVFPTLNFDDSSNELSTEDKQNIDNVVRILNAHPKMELIITVYAQSMGAKSKELVTGLQKGEWVASYLQENGIIPKRIVIRAVSVPLLESKPFLLDFAVAKKEDDSKFPVIGKNYDTEAQGSGMNEGLLYHLQISSSRKLVALKWFDQYEKPMIEKRGSFAYYRYSIGGSTTYKEALRLKAALKKMGKKDAFIVPYIYGVRADKTVAKKMKEQFPDLEDYLR